MANDIADGKFTEGPLIGFLDACHGGGHKIIMAT